DSTRGWRRGSRAYGADRRAPPRDRRRLRARSTARPSRGRRRCAGRSSHRGSRRRNWSDSDPLRSFARFSRGSIASPNREGGRIDLSVTVWQDRRRMRTRTSSLGSLLALALSLLLPSVARAEILVPAGLTVPMYVPGEACETPRGSTGRGIPSTSTLLVDPKGMLYLARTGRRYSSGEYDYLTPMYRIPLGGARLTPSTESRSLQPSPLVTAAV